LRGAVEPIAYGRRCGTCGHGSITWALALGFALGAASGCGDAGPELALVIEPPATNEITVGDFLLLTATATGAVGPIVWSTSDNRIAGVSDGTVEGKRPGTVTISASAAGATSAEIALTVVERPGGYTAAEIDYFAEIAFGAEFGSTTTVLHRWESAPTVRINGSPTPGDLEVLDTVIAEINRLVPTFDIEVVSESPAVEMHFIPQSEFTTVLPQAPPGNNGLVWIWWKADQVIFESVVLISTTTDESLRAHIIREEVTQMLGLLMDSFRYPQSIFYQPFSSVTEYLPIDRVVIELLHRPELVPGMNVEQASRIARTLLHTASGQHAGTQRTSSAGPIGLGAAGSAGGSTVSSSRFPPLRVHVAASR
jgi:hypothetical protein